MQLYYIVYKHYSNLSGKETTHCFISRKHPFEWLKKESENQGHDRITILNFIKVSEQEAIIHPTLFEI
jgi:hypothetical protein